MRAGQAGRPTGTPPGARARDNAQERPAAERGRDQAGQRQRGPAGEEWAAGQWRPPAGGEVDGGAGMATGGRRAGAHARGRARSLFDVVVTMDPT